MKILLGGSPCTYWSIAQKNNRETEPSGLGWELFKNYLIAKEKFKPDIFLYENNKSAAQAIKDEIKKQFGVWDGTMFMKDTGVRYIEINSALVSAQNRQRFYVHNCGNVKQPEDRGILLKDILESGIGWQKKSFAVTTRDNGAIPEDTLKKHRHTMVTEPVKYLKDKNMQHLMRPFGAKGKIVSEDTEKSPTLLAAAGAGGGNAVYYAECATFSPPHGYNKGLIQYDKFPTLTTGSQSRQQNVLIEKCQPDLQIETPLSFINKVYEVRNGYITIKDKQYPIKLKDGFYTIRKLTVTECCRLQTMPDDYCRAVSNSQAYKGLGNGWTAEVILHILSNALKDVPRDTPIQVLSMYDGIGTGRYVLDKMGFTNVEYHAYEIDKYAMQIAMSNYPDIIQHGDAFQVREDDWGIE